MSIYDNTIKFNSSEELLEKIRSKNIVINDENEENIAKLLLDFISYSYIAKGYKNSGLVNDEGIFIDAIKPSELLLLQRLSSDISSILFKYILYCEQSLNTTLSNLISEKFGTDTSRNAEDINNPNDFLYVGHYSNSSKTESILKSIKKHTYKPIKFTSLEYYVNKKNYISPWILLNSVYLSDSINIYKIMKSEYKTIIVNKILPLECDLRIKKSIFVSFLLTIKFLRNKMAHPNMILKHKLKNPLIFKDIGEYSKYTLVSGGRSDSKYRKSTIFGLILSIFTQLNIININLDFYRDLSYILAKYQNFRIFNKDIYELLSIPRNIEDRLIRYINYRYQISIL